MRSNHNFSAVINAGGLGTRLSNLYNGLPKALVPVFKLPILFEQINNLSEQGVTDFHFLLGHKSFEIESSVREHYLPSKLNFYFYTENEALGSGGSIINAIDSLPEYFIFTYCDIFFDLDLAALIDFHCDHESDITLVVHPNDHPYDSDLVSVDIDHQVLSIKAHPHNFSDFTGNLVNAAFYVVNKEVFKLSDLPKGKVDFAQDVLPVFIDSFKVFAYKTPEFLKDMGTPSRLSKVRNNFLNRFSSLGQNKIICLDRDGTINYCLDGEYITSPDQFELLTGVSEAINIFRDLGFYVVCVTNQPVIARGDVDFSTLNKIHTKMEWLLGLDNAYLDEIYFCPHHPDSGFLNEVPDLKFECTCRKPKTGLLDDVMSYLPFKPENSWFVGDSFRDVECGKNYNMKTCSVGSSPFGADVHFNSIFDFALFLKSLSS